ncbi:MAG: hypothetical protein ABI356_01660 [Steroidobacteraceae bacterium]
MQQLLVALIVIAVLKFRFVPADYGLHWPRGKSYVWSAILQRDAQRGFRVDDP